MRKKTIIISSMLVALVLIGVIWLNFRLILNPYFDTVLPQKHFIEIRPIVYGWPTPEMHRANEAGEIILGGDSFAVPRARYAILIKVQPEESD